MMRDAAKSRLFGIHMDFAQRCVELFAAENEHWMHENGRQPSWEAIGFKQLSNEGFDVQGFRIIDYGNREYEVTLLQSRLHSKLNVSEQPCYRAGCNVTVLLILKVYMYLGLQHASTEHCYRACSVGLLNVRTQQSLLLLPSCYMHNSSSSSRKCECL